MKERVLITVGKAALTATVGVAVRSAFDGVTKVYNTLKDVKEQKRIEKTKKLIRESFEELDIIEKSLSLQEEGA